MKKSTLATTLITIGVFFWGWSFVFVKEATEGTDVFSFIFGRFMLAAVCMAVVTAGRFRRCDRTVVVKALVCGGILAFSFIAQTIGVKYTSASNAAFITGLCVVIVPIIVTVLDRRPPGLFKISAILFAFVGLGLLTLKNGFSIRTGDIWLLACAVGFASHLVMMNRYLSDEDTLVFTTIQMLTISLAAGAVGLLTNGGIHLTGDMKVWRAVIFCGTLASAYIYTVQAHLQRYISEVKTAIIFALEPLFAAFAAWIWLHEILTARAMIGGAMIIIGAIFVDVNPLKKHIKSGE